MYDAVQTKKQLISEVSAKERAGARKLLKYSNKSEEENMKFIDTCSDNQKTCTSSLISMEAGSPSVRDSSNKNEIPHARAESSSIRSKSRAKCLYSSVSQHEILDDEDEPAQIAEEGNHLDADSRSSVMRRNSYTLAIYDNAWRTDVYFSGTDKKILSWRRSIIRTRFFQIFFSVKSLLKLVLSYYFVI